VCEHVFVPWRHVIPDVGHGQRHDRRDSARGLSLFEAACLGFVGGVVVAFERRIMVVDLVVSPKIDRGTRKFLRARETTLFDKSVCVLTGVGPAPLGLQHFEGEKSLGFDRHVDGLEHANGTVASLRGASTNGQN
jgi:hypothetical protein